MTRFITLIVFTLVLLNGEGVKAQSWYTFTHNTETYNPLSTGTEVTNGLWTDTDAVVIPVNIDFNINGNKLVFAAIAGGSYLAAENINQYNASFGISMLLEDRGQVTGVPVSPIKYAITGVAGNRIVKIEVTNAAIKAERDIYSTQKDFVNFQYWLCEGSNIIELHFGSSQISHAVEYFPSGCFYSISQGNSAQNLAQYGLSGNPSTPLMDTLDEHKTLASYPISGTVYKFTPVKGVNVKDDAAGKGIQVYPTVCTKDLVIDIPANTTAEYQIISSTGQQCQRGIAVNKTIIDISNLAPATYYVKLLSSLKVYSFPISRQ